MANGYHDMTPLFFLLLLSSSTVFGCFLNSCPYRRYGRNVGCSECGEYGSGLCVGVDRCCTGTDCFPDMRCRAQSQCPSKYCRISSPTGEFITGYCLAQSFCCSNEICQKSMQCVTP